MYGKNKNANNRGASASSVCVQRDLCTQFVWRAKPYCIISSMKM